MKRSLALIAVVFALSGCTTAKHSDITAESFVRFTGRAMPDIPAPTHVVGSYRVKGEDLFGRRILVVGEQRFATLPEFKAFIESLPPCSIVAWDSVCYRFDTIPLLESEMTIRAFTNYCAELGVQFRYYCGY